MNESRVEFAKALLAYGTETMAQESFHQMEAKFGEVMRIYDEQIRESERAVLKRAMLLVASRADGTEDVRVQFGLDLASDVIRALMQPAHIRQEKSDE